MMAPTISSSSASLVIGWPLLLAIIALIAVANLHAAQSISGTTSGGGGGGQLTSIIRLKANKLRRPESCRENLPRKAEDLPALVIIGRVKDVYLANQFNTTTTTTITTSSILTITSSTSNNQDPTTSTSTNRSTSSSSSSSSNNNNSADDSNNRAIVNIGRVLKGNKQLVGSDIIISGFNSSNSVPCSNFVKPNDTLILLLNHDGERKYSIQGTNLLAMNLNNLDRINAIASDEPYKRRGPIEDILCEAHYCAYGRCVVLNADLNQLTCQCPDNCPPLPAPVCGSDNSTYTNECHLIKEGCRRQKPLFVTKEATC